MESGKQPVFGLGEKQQGDDAKGQLEEKKDPTWRSFLFQPFHFGLSAKFFPLIAAILAPLSTLLDIPALSQHWYSQYGIARPDPEASLTLSALSLVFSIFGNVLLIIRFSSKTPYWWQHATRWCLMMWLAKTGLALANLTVFGIASRNGSDWSYSEGFWCAVISVINSGIICITLLLHYFLAFGNEDEDTKEVRTQGRRFMLSVTAFFTILAIQSLVFCKIESWAYSDAIYFSVQTALTIGYGDFAPTTTAGKVLIFPFSVLTISQLGNEIALIISFISSRSAERRDRWKRRYELAMHREAEALQPKATLVEEMALIHQINSREDMMSQMYDLWWSAVSLVSFWVVGSAIFSSIEGWSYGNAVYAVMILSVTIGFGDFTPVQPAGKVFFIVYALAAVPIVTSFAVQTITGLLSTYLQRGVLKEKFANDKQRTPEAFAPHSEFVMQARDTYGDMRKQLFSPSPAFEQTEDDDNQGDCGQSNDNSRIRGDESDPVDERDSEETAVASSSKRHKSSQSESSSKSRKPQSQDNGSARSNEQGHLKEGENRIQDDFDRIQDDPESKGKRTEDVEGGKTDEADQQLEVDLLKQLMDRMVQLEAEARQMLLDAMEEGVARTLLLADRNVQIRDVRSLRGDDANMLDIWRGERDKTAKDKKDRRSAGKGDSEDIDMLSRVKRYRDTFAHILVIGSILQKLEGDELNRFERLRNVDKEEQEEEMHNPMEDLERVADEKYDGITGKMFKHHAKRLRAMSVKENEKKGEGMV